MADVLDTGPPRPPTRSRRWVTVTGAVVLAGVATLLAARSDPDPDPAGTPAPPPTTAPADPADRATLVSVTVGTRAVYALASRCDTGADPVCRYQLHRRSLGDGRWGPLPWEIDPRPGAGPTPVVGVSGDEVITVVASIDPPQVHVSTDDGLTVTVRPVVPGPPVDALSATAVLDPGTCASCVDRITALEPATGRVRLLAGQPPLGGAQLRSVDRSGDVVWVAGAGPGRTATTAVSTDGGRTWRTRPVPGTVGPNQQLQVVAGRDGSAWLVSGSYLGGPARQLTGVRRIDGPGGTWRALPDPEPTTMQSVLAGDRGLLLVEVNGTVWRTASDGRFRRLPDPGLLRPGTLVGGPGREVVSLSPDDATARTVLLSYDEGESWRAEQVF